MFNKEHFIQACIDAVADGPGALQTVMEEAVSDSTSVLAELGEPKHAGIQPVFRSSQLTIINFVWAPFMSLLPHNHQMFSVVGIYYGREDNIFWRRKENSIEAVGARSLGTRDVATLGRDIVHSVLNPIGKMTCALHVYGGDFFQPPQPRSEWDHETLIERPWDIDKVKSSFAEAEARFNGYKDREAYKTKE
jgi:predicted metal-dependent enzyme (double-stranded beta helix superfamily)